jgi:hypothetical protein
MIAKKNPAHSLRLCRAAAAESLAVPSSLTLRADEGISGG